VLQKLRTLARGRPWVGTAISVQERFTEVRGSQLAASITLASFFSIFPLLLLATGVVGFFADSSDLAARVVSRFGLSGDSADAVTSAVRTAEQSRRTASIVGVVGLLWSGLGLVSALQDAYNAIWQVKGRGIKDKAVGLGWLLGAGLIFAASFALGAALRWLPPVLAPVAVVVGVAVNTALFLWTGNVLPNRNVGWKALLPGAVFGGIGLEVLKVVGSYYVPLAVASSSALYGSIGVVFAVLAWLFLFSRLVVYASVLNVVRWEEYHGTVTATLEAPSLPAAEPVESTRGGQIPPP